MSPSWTLNLADRNKIAVFNNVVMEANASHPMDPKEDKFQYSDGDRSEEMTSTVYQYIDSYLFWPYFKTWRQQPGKINHARDDRRETQERQT